MMKNVLLPNLVKGEEALRAQKAYLLETVGKKIEELCPGWLKADKQTRRILANVCATTCKPFQLTAPYAKVSFTLEGTAYALSAFYEKVATGFPTTLPKRGNDVKLPFPPVKRGKKWTGRK